MIISAKEKQMNIDLKRKEEIDKLENFYINGTVNDVMASINKKKDELINKMIEYAKENEKPCKWDKEGCAINWKVDNNPIRISYNFFKPIAPFGAKIPLYNAEKIWLVFEYYMDLVAAVNEHIGEYPPTLTGFAKFIGVSMQTLREYKSSSDLDMRNVMEKIYDQIGEDNLTLSQLGKTRERSTLFRLKAQNEIVEKATPNVNITYKEVINTKKMDEDFDKYQKLLGKKQ